MLLAAIKTADILTPVVKCIPAEYVHKYVVKTYGILINRKSMKVRMFLQIEKIKIVPVLFCGLDQFVFTLGICFRVILF